MSNTEDSEKPQLLADMPEVVPNRRRGAYCSRKEKENRNNEICHFCCVSLLSKTTSVNNEIKNNSANKIRSSF